MRPKQHEQARVATLRGYGLLDTPNEAVFDTIVLDAKQALRMPIVLISLIGADRQWFKAKTGLEVDEIPLCISFCTHAIKGPGVFVVPDAARDPRFADNPLVTGEPLIRFYAGAPLVAHNGRRIGTLCALDTQPHHDFGDAAAATLTALAERTMAAAEVRNLRRRQERPAA